MLETNIIFSIFIISLTFSAISNALLRKLSKTYALLIDQPDKTRKFHSHPTPLIGGFGIFIGMLLTYFVIATLTNENYKYSEYIIAYYLFSFVCLFVFMLDDLFHLSPKIRLILQSSIVFGLLLATDIKIDYLPDLLNLGQIDLNFFSIPFTILCCVGLMNAFNMIDGIDGLCSALAINTLIFIFIDNFSAAPIILIGSILGFIFYNIGFFGKRRNIFLGDNGSNYLGFTIAILCIFYTDNINESNIGNTSAVTMLWFVAIPLWDCIRVIITRKLYGRGAFSPARDHIHHILLSLGLKSENILKLILVLSFLMGILGTTLENIYREAPYVSFYTFVFFSFVYLFICLRIIKKNDV